MVQDEPERQAEATASTALEAIISVDFVLKVMSLRHKSDMIRPFLKDQSLRLLVEKE